MPAGSRSESGNNPAGQQSTAQARAGGTVEGSGRGVAASGGFRLPLPGDLAAVMDPKRLLWLGGLAALATIEVLEWPVAVAIGAGSYVAERFARDDVRRDLRQQS